MRDHRKGRGKPVLLSDVGGVLVEDHWRCVAELLARAHPLDVEATRATLYRLCPPLDLGRESLDDFHRAFVEATGIPVHRAEFRRIVLHQGLRLVRPTFRLYLRLRHEDGVRIIAVSNISEILWASVERRFRLSQVLDDAVISSRVGVTKPDRHIFEVTVKVAGVDPADCIFVDDSATNVRGAQALGIRAFHVTGDPEELERLLAGIYRPDGPET